MPTARPIAAALSMEMVEAGNSGWVVAVREKVAKGVVVVVGGGGRRRLASFSLYTNSLRVDSPRLQFLAHQIIAM